MFVINSKQTVKPSDTTDQLIYADARVQKK